MAQPNTIEALLLVALLPEPGYGFQLADKIGALDKTFRPAPGALYPALQRIEGGGLAISKVVPAPTDRGGRPRRVYMLTPKGRRRALQLARFFSALSAQAQEAA